MQDWRERVLNELAQIAASPSGALFNQAVGLIGLLLGVVGFAVTIWQISRIKTVASAQKDAIETLRFRLSQFDIIAECTKAEAALSDIKKEFFNQIPVISIDNLDRLATAFVSILEGTTSISKEVQSRLGVAIADINKIADMRSRNVEESKSIAKKAAAFRDFHGLIVKIRVQTQKEQKP